ncbi:MAG: hypothetical protein ACM359_18365 [Bacillota bacterium]
MRSISLMLFCLVLCGSVACDRRSSPSPAAIAAAQARQAASGRADLPLQWAVVGKWHGSDENIEWIVAKDVVI